MENDDLKYKFAFRRAKKVFLVINWLKMSIENRNASSIAQLNFSTTDVSFRAIWSCNGGYSVDDGGGGCDGSGCCCICGGNVCGGGVCKGAYFFLISTPLLREKREKKLKNKKITMTKVKEKK